MVITLVRKKKDERKIFICRLENLLKLIPIPIVLCLLAYKNFVGKLINQ